MRKAKKKQTETAASKKLPAYELIVQLVEAASIAHNYGYNDTKERIFTELKTFCNDYLTSDTRKNKQTEVLCDFVLKIIEKDEEDLKDFLDFV